MSAFVVTTSIEGVCRSLLWDSESPLPIGQPLRWLIEKTSRGIRARDLSGPLNEMQQGRTYELTNAELEAGASLPLPAPFQVTIRKTRTIAPLSSSTAAEGERGLRIFECLGPWIRTSGDLGDASGYRAPGFELKKSGDSYSLKALRNGLRIKGGASDQTPAKKESLTFSADALSRLVISESGSEVCWKFNWIQETTAKAEDFSRPRTGADDELKQFQKALKYTLATLGAMVLVAMLWPKPKVAPELIPPQFAKIVLTAPKKAPSAGEKDAGATGPVAKTQQATAQKAALVQTLRAKALQNSLSGLLKGGMTKLLVQSDLVNEMRSGGKNRAMFDGKATGVLGGSTNVGAIGTKSVQVASIGNGGIGGGVGYGKGTHAGIQGQGSSHVSLDIGGSSVEEGLTKDEVGDVIHKHLSEVRYCYESAIIRTPGIEGRLIVNFTIGGSGSVKASEVKTSTLPDPRLDDCILRRLVTWKFPAPKGGADVAVTYPFIFKMLGMGR